MENFNYLYNSLPHEMVNKILFEFNGMAHPVAILVHDYWNQLDDEYDIFIDIKIKSIANFEIDDYGNNLIVNYLDYPRMNFPVDYDIINLEEAEY